MKRTQKKLGIILGILLALMALCVLGAFPKGTPICLWKRFLHFQCPGCGISRGISALLRGQFSETLSYNLLCIPILIGAFTVLILNAYDLIFHAACYEKVEAWLKAHWRLWMLVPLVMLLVLNWSFNMIRGL